MEIYKCFECKRIVDESVEDAHFHGDHVYCEQCCPKCNAEMGATELVFRIREKLRWQDAQQEWQDNEEAKRQSQISHAKRLLAIGRSVNGGGFAVYTPADWPNPEEVDDIEDGYQCDYEYEEVPGLSELAYRV